MSEDYLDCCAAPQLETVRAIHESSHEDESLRQCKNCGRYWFYRFHEAISFGDNDDITIWYSPITEEETAHIMLTEGRPDLSFLANRPSFVKDAGGVRQTTGQPVKPWPW